MKYGPVSSVVLSLDCTLDKSGWTLKYTIFQVSMQSDIQEQNRVWAFKKIPSCSLIYSQVGNPWMSYPEWCGEAKAINNNSSFLNEDMGH